ncbi:MAG: 3-hydroxybutyrate dehydrogenase [Planctomycetaceae bacterium]|nr:3-hydroxybutyrate dehydrogenase [Planctomycetaceae bacterium]
MQQQNQQQTVLITGASSGIGADLAKSFFQAGYRLVLADLNEPDSLTVFEEREQDVLFVQADLSQETACEEIVQQGIERFSSIDVLINNAGVQHVCPIESFPVQTWQKMLAVMLTAPFLLTKLVWPGMKKNGWGRIVNIGSIHSQVASLNKVAYTSAKHGLIGLTKTAALEGGPCGITANAICPAYVRTPLVENQIAAQAKTLGISEEAVEQDVLLKSAATGSLIEPSEVSSLVLYLCSENAKSVTGASWNIDCGWTAQ